MRDRVSPVVHLLEPLLAVRVSRLVPTHLVPERKAQPREVRSDVPRIRISPIQLPREGKLGSKSGPEDSRQDGSNEVVDALGVEVTGEALELRGEKHRIGLVDLDSRPPAPAPAPPDGRQRWCQALSRGSPAIGEAKLNSSIVSPHCSTTGGSAARAAAHARGTAFRARRLQPVIGRLTHYVENRLRVSSHHPKQNAGASFRLSSALFPVTQRGCADPHERSELALAQSIPLTHRADVRLVDPNHTRWLHLTAKNRSALANALEKLGKQFVFHGYSVSTTFRRARRWAGVRSDRSFFA